MAKDKNVYVPTIDKDEKIVVEANVALVPSATLPVPDVLLTSGQPDDAKVFICRKCSKHRAREFGRCEHCGDEVRNRNGKSNGNGSTDDTVKQYRDLAELKNWTYGASERVRPANFHDVHEGFSLLYSRFMVELALPSESAYHQQIIDDLSVEGVKVEEYAEARRKQDATVKAVANTDMPEIFQAALKCGKITPEKLAAMMAIMANG